MDKILKKKTENAKSDENSLMVRLKNNTTTGENSSADSYKVELTCNRQFRDPILRGLPKCCEKLCSYKNLYTKVYSLCICNCLKLEIIQISLRWRVDKQIVVQPSNETIPSNK